MQQLYWNFSDRFGRQYKIGLYHGASGHLIIYCNNNVMTIDFNVQQSKDYTFFIGDELLQLSIQKENEQFQYDCQLDTEAPTARNKARKEAIAMERKHNMWAAGIVVLLVILISLLV
jgi:hypothetical protein